MSTNWLAEVYARAVGQIDGPDDEIEAVRAGQDIWPVFISLCQYHSAGLGKILGLKKHQLSQIAGNIRAAQRAAEQDSARTSPRSGVIKTGQ